jgi:hypothetical protein
MFRRAATFLSAALCSVALSGCTSTLSTTVVITPSSATITTNLHIDATAASVIYDSPSLQKALDAALTKHMGSPQHATFTKSLVTWSASLTYARLIANSSVLGIGALSTATTKSGNITTVSVGVVNPSALTAAILYGARGQQNAPALIATMERYTTLSIVIVLPGSVKLVSATGVQPVISATTASLTQSLLSYHTGAFVLASSPASHVAWYWWLFALLAMAGLIFYLGRR